MKTTESFRFTREVRSENGFIPDFEDKMVGNLKRGKDASFASLSVLWTRPAGDNKEEWLTVCNTFFRREINKSTSIVKSDPRLTVTIQLIDEKTGKVLQKVIFDRNAVGATKPTDTKQKFYTDTTIAQVSSVTDLKDKLHSMTRNIINNVFETWEYLAKEILSDHPDASYVTFYQDTETYLDGAPTLKIRVGFLSRERNDGEIEYFEKVIESMPTVKLVGNWRYNREGGWQASDREYHREGGWEIISTKQKNPLMDTRTVATLIFRLMNEK